MGETKYLRRIGCKVGAMMFFLLLGFFRLCTVNNLFISGLRETSMSTNNGEAAHKRERFARRGSFHSAGNLFGWQGLLVVCSWIARTWQRKGTKDNMDVNGDNNNNSKKHNRNSSSGRCISSNNNNPTTKRARTSDGSIISSGSEGVPRG